MTTHPLDHCPQKEDSTDASSPSGRRIITSADASSVLPPMIVEHVWDVNGAVVYEDHGYVLYSAIKAMAPCIAEDGVQVIGLQGERQGQLLDISKGTQLIIRAPEHLSPGLSALDGKTLRLGEWHLSLSASRHTAVTQAPHLASRCVVYRNARHRHGMKGIAFALKLGLDLGPIIGEAQAPRIEIGPARCITIKGHRVWGHGVEIGPLSEDASHAVLAYGLGGKKSMGAGVFWPKEAPNG